MATYLPGVTDYIPQVQPWEPDYNFYQNSLERKQTQYDRGWEQTNSLYNSILNAPMMRDQNIERRDTFFKDIEGQIQQLSGVDLSLAQNVDSASKIFKPFYEDNNIMKDIGFTKQYRDQMNLSQQLKNCTDEKKCGDKYWAGGVKILNYKAQDFRNATDEEALNMQAPEYVNKFNFMKNAEKAVSDAKFSMTQDKITGGYNVTTKDGKQLIAPLREFMMARFGDDPAWSAYNEGKAYLLRKENPEAAISIYEQQALQSKAKSPEEYKTLLAEKTEKKRYEDAKTVIAENAKTEKSGLERMMERKAILQGIIDTEGVLPGSDDDKAYMDVNANLPIKEQAAKRAEELSNMYNELNYIDEDGNKIPNNVIDKAVANAMMIGEIENTANILAYRNYSETKKADPYALAGYKDKLAKENIVLKASLDGKKSSADATVKYIREVAEKGTREEVARADYIDNLMIEKGYSADEALYDYRTKKLTGFRFFDWPADKRNDPKEGRVNKEKVETDTFTQQLIGRAQFSTTKSEGQELVTEMNNTTVELYNSVKAMEDESAAAVNTMGVSAVSGLINDLVTNPNATKESAATLGYLGDLIADLPPETVERLSKMETWDGPVRTNVYDRYFAEFPTSADGYTRDNPAINNLKDDKAMNLIVDAIGPEQMVELLTEKDGNPKGNYFNKLLPANASDDLTDIIWKRANAKGMASALKNHINGVATEFGSDLDEESVITKIMKQNIIVDRGDMKLIAKPSDFYYKVVKDSPKILADYDEEHITSGISPNIIELENNLSSGGDTVLFTGANLKGLLATADAQPLDAIDLKYGDLFAANGYARPSNYDVRGFFIGGKTRDKAWELLMNDPQTNVVRSDKDPSKIIIKSPHFKNGHSQIYDLSNIDAHAGIQNILDEVSTSYPKVTGDFSNKMQKVIDNKNSVFGRTGSGLPIGNYNTVSAAISDIQINPLDPIRGYNEVVAFGQEIQNRYHEPLPKGVQQGSKELLDVYLAATNKSYTTDTQKKAAPDFTVEYNANAGKKGYSSYTIKLNNTNLPNFMEAIGRDIKVNDDPDDKTKGSYTAANMPTEGIYYIKDSESSLIQKAKPDVYTNIFNNLDNNDTFTDDSQKKEVGFTTYTRKGSDMVMTVHTKEYNPDTKQMVPVKTTSYIEDYESLRGGWENIVKKNNNTMHALYNRQMEIYRANNILKTTNSY